MGIQLQTARNIYKDRAFTLVPSVLLQRKCAYVNNEVTDDILSECAKEKQKLQRRAISDVRLLEIPPVVHSVLRYTGRPLNAETLGFMEPRFGQDFSSVRVHTDSKAAESAREVSALAYTVGKDVVFGAGQYSPSTVAGQRLLAHELTHVVQQQGGYGGDDAESHADLAAERVIHGESVTPEMAGAASPGLYVQNDEEQQTRKAPTTEPSLRLDWEALSPFGLSPGMPSIRQSGAFQLAPPTLSMRSPLGPQPSSSPQTPPSMLTPGLQPPMLLPPGGQPGLRPPWLTPPRATAPSSASTPEAPSRLPILSTGQFSIGLRLSFPEFEATNIPGAPPSALQESLRRAEIMSQTLSGRIPTGWEVIDKAQLASAVWGIFSTHIAPDVARRITSGLSVPIGPGRTSFELDLVILSDFSGGGISFTVRHP